MDYAVAIRNLHKRFNSHIALNGLNLNIPAGSIFGLVGQNGAGKTTTFSILAGFLSPDSGEVDILGLGAFNPARHKGRVTILPQDSRLPGYARVGETLRYLARLQGMNKSDAKRSVQQVLDWVSLTDREKKPIRTLSHGMLRRVYIAQAFLGDPDLVLLDEPTSGLDPLQVVQIREIISARRKTQTIVISSHILSEIEAACDHVAFIERGVTIRQDSLDAVVNRNQIYLYRLKPDRMPIQKIAMALPDAEISVNAESTVLSVKLNQIGIEAEEINRVVLGILLSENIGILEVRRGSNLESEYLKQL